MVELSGLLPVYDRTTLTRAADQRVQLLLQGVNLRAGLLDLLENLLAALDRFLEQARGSLGARWGDAGFDEQIQLRARDLVYRHNHQVGNILRCLDERIAQ